MNHVSARASSFVPMRWVSFAVALSGSAAGAVAQSDANLTFVSRNGGNLAACALQPGGPSGSHAFATPTPTNDLISVSDPGDLVEPVVWGPSEATSHLIATPASNGLVLAASGTASRDPLLPLGFGTTAVADARDVWTFTLTAPVHFTLNVSISATSTEPVVSTANFLFAGTSITADPGTIPPPYPNALTVPGTLAFATSGTLGPGQYFLGLNNRAESVFNSWPFSGSFQSSVALAIQPLAAAAPRNAAPNPLSYTAGLPVLGQTWNGSIDLALTGQSLAQVFASSAAAQVALASGQVLLISPPVFSLTPLLPGPLANFSLALPADPALAGVFLPTQALHVGGAPSFALSNALDLTLGY